MAEAETDRIEILSPARRSVPLLTGLPLPWRGKVRDTYDLGDKRLLVVTTDGISIFDFVLNALVPQKGYILNALSHYWFRRLAQFGIPTHLMSAGADIDLRIPDSLSGNPDLQVRAMVVRRLTMVPVEFVARGFLTGSGFRDYQKTSQVCGHDLPGVFQDGDNLPYVLDTPTTKAKQGHDQPLDAFEIRRQYPEETCYTLTIYQLIANFARAHGILFADTKLEFGRDAEGVLRVGDELGTCDSSRWWERRTWEESRNPKRDRKAPPPLDKQLAREWGSSEGIHRLDASDPEDIARVHALLVPPELVTATTQTFRYLLWRVIGETLEDYSRNFLRVRLDRPQKRVAVVMGSQSDLPLLEKVLGKLNIPSASGQVTNLAAHVISCHRNPTPLRNFVTERCGGSDVVVAIGSKALALPGVLDALIYEAGLRIPVVGVALGEPGSEALEAAKLSIKQLPEQPVIMDELRDKVYAGAEGLEAALTRIHTGELPPPKPRVEKPPEFNLDLSRVVSTFRI